MISEEDQLSLSRVTALLGSGRALAQDIEEYVVGFAVLGNLVSMAQGEYEYAEQRRKMAWARAFVEAKQGSEKVTEKVAAAMADIAVDPLKQDEILKHEQLTNLRSMRETVSEAINGVKYMGRMGG